MFFVIIIVGIVLAFILSMIFRSAFMRRALWYKSPFPESGAEGVLGGLSSVEAGIVLSVDPSRLLAMYLLDLATCRDVKILDDVPLRIEVTAQGSIPEFRKRFLGCVRDDGSLDPEKMLLALDFLYTDLKKRILDYGTKETVGHYLRKVDALWDRIQKERTSSAKLQSLQDEFPWLLLHEDAPEQLEQMFRNSPRWHQVQPIVRLMRIVKGNIVTNEQLLEHAAEHPDGFFSNKSHRDGITGWARTHLRHSSIAEAGMMAPYLVTDELQKEIDARRAELKKKNDRIQHLIGQIEEQAI